MQRQGEEGRVVGRTRAALAGVMVAALAGCAVVEVHAPAGESVTTEWYPGVLVVRLEPGASADAVVAEAAGAGILSRPGGLTVGTWRETVAALPPDCRLVVWPRSGVELERVLARLKDVPGSCIIGPPPGGGESKGEEGQ